MESFLIPLLIVVVVVALGLLFVKHLSKRPARENDGGGRGRSARGPAAVASREEAVRASSRLNQQQHSAVYALLARGDALNAIMEYRKATGAKLREAATAIASMSTYPQPYGAAPVDGASPADGPAGQTDPSAGTGGPADRTAETGPAGPGTGGGTSPGGVASPDGGAGTDGGGGAGGGAGAAPRFEAASEPSLSKPQAKEPAGGYRYRAIVSQGDEIREIASTRLNDEVFGQIKDTALTGDRESAIRLLMEHSEADEQQARDFVRLIQPEPPAGAKG